MDAGILVAGEPDVAHLAGLPRLQCGLEAALVEHPVRIVVVDHFVELPEVDAIRPETPQAVVEALHRPRVVALAVLRHEKDLVAAAVGERASHDFFGAAVVIVPAVVEEREPFIDRGVHDADCLG